MEPMPPITTTAKTAMIRLDPISGLIWMMGAASTPARAASAVGQHHHEGHVDAKGLN